jgi:NAD(P)-dependent dehydrogenase (short-subunit alcohol dehydrogenase family)
VSATTTTDEVLQGLDLAGTRALVTGAATGLGRETARALAAHGAAVTLAGRDDPRLRGVARELIEATGNPALDTLELDLASLDSVRAAAQQFRTMHQSLDLLINNAGVMACPLARSAEGHEMQFAACHLGHFLFTCLLAPWLIASAPARIVNLSSAGHRLSPVHFEDIDYRSRPYEKWEAYGQAKTANVLFSVALQRRLGAFGITANAVHPGAIAETRLGRHLTRDDLAQLLARTGRSEGLKYKSVQAGAATTVWAAVTPQLAARGGLYLEDCAIGVLNDDPGFGGGGYRSYATDAQAAERLWSVSEQLVGERFAWGAA